MLAHEDNRAGLMGWPAWFARMGVKGYSGKSSLKFNSHPLLLQAACDGQGIALGWSVLVDDLLADGTLVRPLQAELESARAFYFVLSNKTPRPETLALQAWLSAQFQDPARSRFVQNIHHRSTAMAAQATRPNAAPSRVPWIAPI